MNLSTSSHFTLLYDVRKGDLCTYYMPDTGEAVTFEVTALLPTPSNAIVLLDTTVGPIQALAGTPIEVFDGFDLSEV